MELEALHLKVRGEFALVGFGKGSGTTIDLTHTDQTSPVEEQVQRLLAELKSQQSFV